MLWTLDRSGALPLHEQLAACVRRAVVEGDVAPGDRLPPARDLAEVVDVHANTVLQAYRALREEGIVEFRRGRGVQVSATATRQASVHEAVHALIRLGRSHGYNRRDLVELIQRLDPSGGATT